MNVTHINEVTTAAKPIYRGMDRATLDAAYNNSAAVIDSPQWLDNWKRRSEASRNMPGAELDVPYAPRARTRFDYFPSGTEHAPLFVFIHGGYWQRNAKELFSFLSEGPRHHGIDVVMLGYTLAPEASLTQIVAEIQQALSHLEQHAGDFGFDVFRMHVGGWSAGGHLAALAGRWPHVKSSLCISGIFDLEPISLSYLNEALQLTRDEIQALSPLSHLPTRTAPHCLAVGGDELSELQRQSADYTAAAVRQNLSIKLKTLPGHNHFSILDELANPDGALTRELVKLVFG